jgi:hypothetical protein
MTGHLNDAAHQLDLSAIGCHYLAHGITEDLSSVQEHQAAPAQQATVPDLTRPQYDALTSFLGGARLYESSQRGPGVTRVATNDGARVSIATYRALAKPRPHAALTAAATAPPKAAARQGIRR